MTARQSGSVLLSLVGMLAVVPPAGACITYIKIADSGTPVPGGTGTFSFLGTPSYDGHNVAFTEAHSIGPNQILPAGVYKYADGVLGVVADCNTLIPGTDERFHHFNSGVSVSAGEVLFVGHSASGIEGIYIAGDELTLVVDNQTPIPGGSGNFASFNHISRDGRAVMFEGVAATGERGLYLCDDGEITLLVDQTTLIPPDDHEPFGIFTSTAVRGDTVVFCARAADGSPGGIYSLVGDEFTCIVDDSFEIPEGTGLFNSNGLGGAAIDIDGSVKFGGQGADEQHGVYLATAGQIERVADKSCAMPGFGHEVTEFGASSIDNGNVAFTLRCCAAPFGIPLAVYANYEGLICRFIGAGDDVGDGRIVSQAISGGRCISGNRLVAEVWYDGGIGTAVYLVEFRPGDLDGDRDVDLLDLAQLLGHFGTRGSRAEGDIDGNGRIRLSDLEILLTNYGRTWAE